jgi:TrmH RNA methyltransferase
MSRHRERNSRSHDREDERSERIAGINAALAVARVRPSDIFSVTYTRSARAAIDEILVLAARRRIPYEEVSDAALSKQLESTHHEGICLSARPRPLHSLIDLIERLAAPDARGALVLDRVTNPHNFGAIIRSAAYFGLDAVMVESTGSVSPWTTGAVRVAEGGAESISLVTVPDLAGALESLRARGFEVLGADADAKISLYEHAMRSPSVVVMGNERVGLRPSVREACTETVSIPGSERVDSLNVSVAAGILIAEMARNIPRRRRPV